MSANQSHPQQNANPQTHEPGLVASHAEYVKGAGMETIGQMTGSTAWSESGRQAKAEAVAHMQHASAARDPAAHGWGRPEELAGKVTGCEGMVKEGLASEGQGEEGKRK